MSICKKFFAKYLPKGVKNKCNQLGKRYRRLEDRDERNDTDDFHGSDEPSEIRDKIIALMEPAVKRYAKDLFSPKALEKADYISMEGEFVMTESFGDDSIEFFCVKRRKLKGHLDGLEQGYVASVRTSYWDAPEWTCDDSTAVPTLGEAFEWGFGDAMAYHFISEEVRT